MAHMKSATSHWEIPFISSASVNGNANGHLAKYAAFLAQILCCGNFFQLKPFVAIDWSPMFDRRQARTAKRQKRLRVSDYLNIAARVSSLVAPYSAYAPGMKKPKFKRVFYVIRHTIGRSWKPGKTHSTIITMSHPAFASAALSSSLHSFTFI